MSILNKIKRKINIKIGSFLRSRYQSFRVTRPYVVNIRNKNSLTGKIARVTGGSGAIGRACCFRLAAEGAIVYVCGTRKESIEPVVNEIINAGYKAKPQILDVLDSNIITKVFKDISDENNGSIDILINSAGGSARDKANTIVNQDIDVIDNILNINLRGAMLCAKEVSKYMINKKSGRIINITSVIGLQGRAGFSEYAASKGGSIAFVKSLAQELGKYGITVNSVAPGIVQRGEITPDLLERIRKTNVMNTYGRPEDISNAVNFLCSKEASFITGQTLAVDGGRSLGLKEN